MSKQQERPSADLAVYDQALASANTEIDRLVATLDVGIGVSGEHQALANIGLMLSVTQDKNQLVGLLAAALLRIHRDSTGNEN